MTSSLETLLTENNFSHYDEVNIFIPFYSIISDKMHRQHPLFEIVGRYNSKSQLEQIFLRKTILKDFPNEYRVLKKSSKMENCLLDLVPNSSGIYLKLNSPDSKKIKSYGKFRYIVICGINMDDKETIIVKQKYVSGKNLPKYISSNQV